MSRDPIATAANTERRGHPRWTTAGLESALGRVTDLSLSGLRIRKTGHPGLREGDRFRLEVKHEATVFLVPAQLASTRPHAGESGDEGGNMVDLGIRFPDLTRAQKKAIERILEEAGWPDGGGEIVFRPLPADEEAGRVGELLTGPFSSSDPEPEPEEDEQPEEQLGALRSWSQLTEAADAPGRGPSRPEPAKEAAEPESLAPLERVAGEAAELAGEAAAAAAAPAPAASTVGGVAGLRHAPVGGVAAAENKRKNGRLVAQDAHTALGVVLDISASGMRIRRRGARPVSVGSTFLLDLYVCGRAVRLPVEVVRIQKSGWRSHDYGLRFGELPPEMRAQFGQLARMAAKHVSIA